jgi:hypothetical protein
MHSMMWQACQSKAAQRARTINGIVCFAERRHALSFQLKFGGELLDRRGDAD